MRILVTNYLNRPDIVVFSQNVKSPTIPGQFNLYIYEDYKEMVSSINRSGDGPMLRTENGSSVSSCTFKS